MWSGTSLTEACTQTWVASRGTASPSRHTIHCVSGAGSRAPPAVSRPDRSLRRLEGGMSWRTLSLGGFSGFVRLSGSSRLVVLSVGFLGSFTGIATGALSQHCDPQQKASQAKHCENYLPSAMDCFCTKQSELFTGQHLLSPQLTCLISGSFDSNHTRAMPGPGAPNPSKLHQLFCQKLPEFASPFTSCSPGLHNSQSS